MSSHELQSAFRLMEFLKMCYERLTVLTLSREQYIPVLEMVRNMSFLSTILELYSEIALSQKPFGIGHMYIYMFLPRMTDTVTSQNIELSSWDTLYSIN
jgi:hypothetical protein